MKQNLTLTLKTIFVAMAFILIAGCNETSGTTNPVSKNLTGKWTGNFTYMTLGTGTVSLNIVDVAGTLTGTGELKVTALGQTQTLPIAALTGSFNDPNVTLTLPLTGASGSFNGTLSTDGKTISGKINVSTLGLSNMDLVLTKQ